MTDTTSPAEARTLVQAGALPEETSVVNQIANYLQTGGLRAGQEIVIRLNPPDLGRVRLSLQVQGKDLCGLVEVDNRRALGELQREAPILVSRLADSGVNLRRMEIVLNDPSQQAGTEGSHSTPRDGQGQAQQQEILTAQPPVMSGSVFEEAASEAVGFARQAVVSDDSVNVWM
jgi:flagellar hook-length control protein FliK